jgi:hypothetical protein
MIVDPDCAGMTMGYSVAPDMAVDIDELKPADVAAVIGAVFAVTSRHTAAWPPS